MNEINFQDDPKLTAYALGELSQSEREQVEALLRDDEAARQAVEEIRATAGLLSAELQQQSSDAMLTDSQRQVIASTRPRRSLRSRFAMTVASGLAAAAMVTLAIRTTSHSHSPAREVALKVPSQMKQIGTASKLEFGRPQDQLTLTPQQQQAATGQTDSQNIVYGDHHVEFEQDPFKGAKRDGQYVDPQHKELETTSDSTEEAGQLKSVSEAASAVANAPLAVNSAKVGPSPHPSSVANDRWSAGFKLNNSVVAESIVAKDGDIGGAADDARRVRESAAGHKTESYDRINDNSFLDVAKNPLSTFSIDVDTASYSNVRRFINEMSQLPPKDAVRIEEMINYFPYSYPQPVGDAPFGASIEVANCPWNVEHRLVRIALKGKEIAKENRPASNLVFLIDVSGSMEPANKLPLLKSAMQRLVRELTEKDRVAIVVYAGNSGLVLPSTLCDEAHQQAIIDSLGKLEAGGSTNGAAGIELAYQVATENFVKDGTNRVILCTDGDFNVGVTNQGDLTRLIEDKAKSNVFLSVLGFGMGNVKDSTMEKLADKGNGNYAYIDTPREANKVLVEQMSGTLITIAKDVKIQVEFNPAKVGTYRLIGYENRMLAKEDFNDDKKDAGEIGAGHTVTAMYEIAPVGAKGDAPAVDPLKYQDNPAMLTVDVAKARLDVKREVLRRKMESKGAFSDAEIEEARLDVVLAEKELAAAQTGPTTMPSDELLTVKLRYKAPDAPIEQGTSRLLEFPVKDVGERFEKASKDFKFASAVAGFGMVLRDSQYKGNLNLDAVMELAQDGRGEDANGYRGEFIEMVKKAKMLKR